MAYNSSELFSLMQSASTPGKWKTPESLKKTYAEALASYSANDKTINKSLKELGNGKALTDSAQFKALNTLYSKLYDSAGELALKNFGGEQDSFSSPASALGFSSFMAKKGEALPNILKSALKVSSADNSAKASSVKVLREQSNMKANAMSSLFNSQLESLSEEAKSRRKAYEKLANSLLKSYNIKKKAEK